MSNILSYLKSGDPEGLKLTALAEELESKLNLLDRVLVVARGNVLSETLQKLDQERDLAIRAFYNALKIYVSFPDDTKSSAALFLQKLVEKYGKEIDKMSYSQESGALTNVLQELETEENAARIALLHLDDWIEELKAAQTEFNLLFIGRESENAGKFTGEAYDARLGVQEVFDRLGRVINAYEIVYGAEAYTSLASKINEAVNYARQQADRRGTRKTSAASTGTEE